jgi:hypothetical protein
MCDSLLLCPMGTGVSLVGVYFHHHIVVVWVPALGRSGVDLRSFCPRGGVAVIVLWLSLGWPALFGGHGPGSPLRKGMGQSVRMVVSGKIWQPLGATEWMIHYA